MLNQLSMFFRSAFKKKANLLFVIVACVALILLFQINSMNNKEATAKSVDRTVSNISAYFISNQTIFFDIKTVVTSNKPQINKIESKTSTSIYSTIKSTRTGFKFDLEKLKFKNQVNQFNFKELKDSTSSNSNLSNMTEIAQKNKTNKLLLFFFVFYHF